MCLFPANVSLVHIGRDRRRRKHQRGTYAVSTARPTSIFSVHASCCHGAFRHSVCHFGQTQWEKGFNCARVWRWPIGPDRSSLPPVHCMANNARQSWKAKENRVKNGLKSYSACPALLSAWFRAPLASYMHPSPSMEGTEGSLFCVSSQGFSYLGSFSLLV